MDIPFRSAMTCYGENIDCRRLTLSLRFYQLPFPQVSELCMEAATWLTSLFTEGFVNKWSIGERSNRSKHILDKLEQHLSSGERPAFDYTGYVISPTVFNLSSLNKQEHFMIYRDIYTQAKSFFSADYPSYWESLFPNGCPGDKEEIAEKVWQIFQVPHKKKYAAWMGPDVTASFSSMPYRNQPESYYGAFSCEIGAFCLDDKVQELAEVFLSKAIHIAQTYHNMNAFVMLQPATAGAESPYMHYFGSHARYDDSHKEAGHLPEEWYKTYYLRGVEWANILSPLTQTHFSGGELTLRASSEIQIDPLQGGCVLVKSKKRIESYDVKDALLLKEVLQPALFSGGQPIR